jgi:hypothetical protein
MQTLINSQRYQKLDPEGRGRNREITETEQRIAGWSAVVGRNMGSPLPGRYPPPRDVDAHAGSKQARA